MSKPKVSRKERGEAPTFYYSNKQLADIRGALPAPMSDAEFANCIRALHFCINTPPLEGGEVITEGAAYIAGLAADVEALAKAVGMLKRRASEMHSDDSGNKYNDVPLHVLPALAEYQRSLEVRCNEAERLLALLRQDRTSNNYRAFQDQLCQRALRTWTRMGGQINFEQGYRSFFEAIVKPVLSHRDFQRYYDVTWTGNSFRSHVNKEIY